MLQHLRSSQPLLRIVMQQRREQSLQKQKQPKRTIQNANQYVAKYTEVMENPEENEMYLD